MKPMRSDAEIDRDVLERIRKSGPLTGVHFTTTEQVRLGELAARGLIQFVERQGWIVRPKESHG